MKKLVLALSFLVFMGAPFANSNDMISSESVTVFVDGEILDTDLGFKPKSGDQPQWLIISKVALRANKFIVEDAEPLKPVFVHAMNRLTRKASVKLSRKTIDDSDTQDILKAHRRKAGFGVHGPLRISGRVTLTFEVYEDRVALVMVLELESVAGPNGTWNSSN
ncbi:hypothetical protein HOF92_14565 [bacterium]|jgi:hypothetical protein|nr:hypothetical protein [bacterium]